MYLVIIDTRSWHLSAITWITLHPPDVCRKCAGLPVKRPCISVVGFSIFLLLHMMKGFAFFLLCPFVLIGRIKFFGYLQNELRNSMANDISIVSGFVLFLI